MLHDRFGQDWHSRSSEKAIKDANRRRATNNTRNKQNDERQPIAIDHLNDSGNLIHSFLIIYISLR